ncbi:hypothetical protein K439DRAFT_1624858 [Ramaria rubella]|nr:hypothetical protein K439DRAFT_1624858 [Ramaria rubella]
MLCLIKCLKPLCQGALASINTGPTSLLEAACLCASVVGSPNLGVDDNVHFAAFQLNFSNCYKHGKAGALAQELGFFGGMHVDSGDHLAYLSNLTILSDLPPDYHPGVFMLYELGVYIRMDSCIGVNFSGLCFHSGTAPTAPLGQEPDPSLNRLVHVAYPPNCVMDMSSRQVLGGLLGGNMLYVTPEMSEHRLLSPNFNVPSNQLNHTVDGVGLMTRQAHTSFIACMCLRVVQYITSQLPSAYNMHVNPMTFMQTFEFEKENGTMTVYRNVWNSLDEYGAAAAKFIPLLANRDADSDTFEALYHVQSQVHPQALDHASIATEIIEEVDESDDAEMVEAPPHKRSCGNMLINPCQLTLTCNLFKSYNCTLTIIHTIEEHGHNEDGILNNIMDIEIDEAVNEDTRTCSALTSVNIRPDNAKLTPFFYDLSIDNLQKLCEKAYETVQRVGPANQLITQGSGIVKTTTQNLCELCMDLHEKPFKNETVLRLKDAWQLIVGGKHTLARANIESLILRQFTMLATACAWTWLESRCRRVLQGQFKGITTPGTEWLHALCDKLVTYYMSRNQYILYINRCDYELFKDLPSKQMPIAPVPTKGPGSMYPQQDWAHTRSIEATIKTIATWLEYPDMMSISQVQGAFASMMIDLYGSPDVLLLDNVWNTFCHLKPRLFGNRKLKNIENVDLFALRTAIESHLIMDSYYGSWTPYHAIDNTLMVGHQLATFVLLLLPILRHPQPNHEDSPLFKLVKTDGDFYLLFREQAPSRSHVLQERGPFEMAYMNLRGGLFRRINLPRFDVLGDWTEYHDLHSNLDFTHFCKMTAYGTPNVFRGPAHIEAYWKGTATWEKTLQHGFNTFTELWEYSMRVKKGRKVVPHIGNLSAYLLATNIAYTGLVPHATAKEVGKIIYISGKGSYHQMVDLKLIEQDSNAEDCVIVYEKLFHELIHLIPEDAHELIKFDVYSPEYALCKRSRLVNVLPPEA